MALMHPCCTNLDADSDAPVLFDASSSLRADTLTSTALPVKPVAFVCDIANGKSHMAIDSLCGGLQLDPPPGSTVTGQMSGVGLADSQPLWRCQQK